MEEGELWGTSSGQCALGGGRSIAWREAVAACGALCSAPPRSTLIPSSDTLRTMPCHHTSSWKMSTGSPTCAAPFKHIAALGGCPGTAAVGARVPWLSSVLRTKAKHRWARQASSAASGRTHPVVGELGPDERLWELGPEPLVRLARAEGLRERLLLCGVAEELRAPHVRGQSRTRAARGGQGFFFKLLVASCLLSAELCLPAVRR